jgi:hypothetical protein
MTWIFEPSNKDIQECMFCGSEVYVDLGYCVECDAQLGSPLSAERPAKVLVCNHEDAPCCGCDNPIQYLDAEIIA